MMSLNSQYRTYFDDQYLPYLKDIVASLYLSVRLFILTIVIFYSAYSGLFSLGFSCAALGMVFWFLDRRIALHDPASLLLAGTGLFMLVADLFIGESGVALSTRLSPVPVGILFIYYLAYTLLKQPFAELYAKVDGIPRFRKQVTWLWIVGYGFGFAMLLLSLELPWAKTILLVTPPLFMICQLYIQIKGFNGLWEPPAERKAGKYRFTKVDNTKEGLRPVYALFLKEMLSLQIIDANHKVRSIPFEQLVEEQLELEKDSWDHVDFIVAYRDDELVGCLNCQYDKPGKKFPFESVTTEKRCVDKLRSLGRVVEGGKFCVKHKYRLNIEIMIGLVTTSFEYSLARGATFILTRAINPTIKMYAHLGFKQVNNMPATNVLFGNECALMVMNLTTLATNDNSFTKKTKALMSPYVICHAVNRQMLNAILVRGKKPIPSQVSNDELSDLTT